MRAFAAIGALMLCFALGVYKRSLLLQRQKWLEGYVRDLDKLRSIMELTPMPLLRAISKLSMEIWQGFASNLTGESAARAWKLTVENTWELCEADRECVLMLTDALECQAARELLDTLELNIRNVERQRQDAARELERKGKLYTSLGALMGLCAALLII